MPTLVIIKKLLTNRQQFILSFLNNVQTMLFLMTCSITMGKCFISSSCTFSAMSSGVSLGSSLTENCAMCSPASSSGLTKWMVMPLTVSPAAFTADVDDPVWELVNQVGRYLREETCENDIIATAHGLDDESWFVDELLSGDDCSGHAKFFGTYKCIGISTAAHNNGNLYFVRFVLEVADDVFAVCAASSHEDGEFDGFAHVNFSISDVFYPISEGGISSKSMSSISSAFASAALASSSR